MCGLAGFSGRFDRELLARMNRALAHRGPDDSGTFFDAAAECGLAHRRLSIIDLSAKGKQPMWDPSHTVCIVYNGELYNYRELRGELSGRGFEFDSMSDTEVLLNAYLDQGAVMIERLNGIFAFALFDTRDRSLFLARDGFGVKPLYYAETPKGILFASELKALLHEPSLDREIDFHALQTYLTYLWCPSPRTLLRRVKKMSAGHAMILRAGAVVKEWKYYELPYGQPLSGLPEKELTREFDRVFDRAVERQMVSDAPVGAFLSGGLDSSAIVARAREHYERGKLQCFTIGFRDNAYEKDGMAIDLPYAQRAAKYLDVDLHVITVEEGMAGYLERMIYHLDEPQADFAPINVYFIARLAREHGMKVLLSGAGGDDILAGYRRHRALLMERYWSWLPVAARRALSGASGSLPKTYPLFRRIAKAFGSAALPSQQRLLQYFFWLPREVSAGLLNPELRADLPDPGLPLERALTAISETTPDLNRMLFLDTKFFLTDHNLNYTDKLSMAAGIETRVPFLDVDLVRFCAALPLDHKLRHGVGKRILRKAMDGRLPREVLYRPKTGFGVPLRSWLRNDLKGHVEEILSEQTLKNRGFFDPKSVAGLIKADREGKIDAAFPILSMMCIELWCRVFLDHPDPSAFALDPPAIATTV